MSLGYRSHGSVMYNMCSETLRFWYDTDIINVLHEITKFLMLASRQTLYLMTRLVILTLIWLLDHGLTNRNCGSVNDSKKKQFFVPQKRSDLLGYPHKLPSVDTVDKAAESRSLLYVVVVKNVWSCIAILPYEEQPRRTY